MGACGNKSFLFDYEEPFQNFRLKKKEQTYLEYVKERKEIEGLMNPKKWWEFWKA